MRLDFLKNPLVVGVVAGVAGLILGLVFAWLIWPAELVDAPPNLLRADYKEDYLRMAIDSFEANPDPDIAWIRYQNIQPGALQVYQTIRDNPASQDPGAILKFGDVIKARMGSGDAANPQPTQVEPGPTPGAGSNLLMLGLIGVLALFAIAAAVYFGRRLLGGKVAPENYSAARQAQEIAKSTEKTDFSKMGLQDPITRTMTTYVLGDDLYDESFSIDSQGGEFLGEYGVGVSEAIGVGDPKKVTAIEIWLFDKNDIKTATKVLMTPHAFSDTNIRARLEAKGELVLAELQKQVLLETATLQLLATLVDLEFGKGSMPDKSYYERITLELAIWPKG